MSKGVPAVAALALALLGAGLVAGQAAGPEARPRPRFSSVVDVVNLNVSVTDVADHHVTDLEKGDFTVLEDGVPQQLSFFTREQLPLSLAVLVDSSASMTQDLPAVKSAALRLLRALRPEDQAEIGHFDHRFEVLQDFTNDPTRLEDAVRGIKAGGQTSIYDAVYVTLKDPHFRVATQELRRQAVVVLSDGEDTSSLVSDDQVVELARRNNVTVFAIDLVHAASATRDPVPGDRATHFLTALTRETGGRAFFSATLSQLDGVYGRIAEDLRTQYALGYVSSNPARDGRWRRISIATRPANLLVRHKPGYYAGPFRAQAGSRSPAGSAPAPRP